MQLVLQVVLSNAVAAVILAAVALVVGRLVPRPRVVHWVWALVLLKLVTPPLARVPLPWPPLAKGRRPEASSAVPARREVTLAPVLSAARIQPPPPSVARKVTPRPVPPVLAEPEGLMGRLLPWLDGIAVVVWLGAGALYWAIAGLRVRSFQGLLGRCSVADPQVQERVGLMAGRLGLRRVPSLCLSPGVISPLLWAFGRRPRLVVPLGLWEQLEPDQRDSLLLHELAHLKRGDHRVRVLEVVAIGLYWWHPVAWWARRALRAAEEECCDDMVVWAMAGQPRAYAYTLLDTVDFLAESPGVAPFGAGGLIEGSQLKRRLVRILGGGGSVRLTRRSLLGLLALTAAALVAGPASRVAVPSYRVLDLRSLGGRWTEGTRLNDLAEVIGYSTLGLGDPEAMPWRHAFKTLAGRPIDAADDLSLRLPLPPGIQVHVAGINNAGQVALMTSGGGTGDPDWPYRGLLLDGRRLVDLGGDRSILAPNPAAINDRGQMVGTTGRRRAAPVAAGYDPAGFRTRPGKAPDLASDGLGDLGGGHVLPACVNRNGQVAGSSRTPEGIWHAFRTAPDRPIRPATDDLGTLGGPQSEAHGINDLGQVVGHAELPGAEPSQHAFRTAPNRAIDPATDDLGTLGGTSSSAAAINNRGDVVGWASTVDERSHAFLHTGGRMIDLNDRIRLAPGWTIREARDINNRGQILAIAERFDREPIDGAGRGMLVHSVRTLVLSPDTSLIPSTIVLVGATLTGSALGWTGMGRSRWLHRVAACLVGSDRAGIRRSPPSDPGEAGA